MSSNGHFVCGAYQVHALGDVDIQSQGSGVTIRAAGEEADLFMDADGAAHLSSGSAVLCMDGSVPDAGKIDMAAGTAGVINIWSGMPLIGALIKIEADQITLSVGPPGVGAMIQMTAEGIIIQVAQTTFQMTAEGITEQLAEVQRELGPLGHTLTAAETEAEVQATGFTVDAPMSQMQAEASGQLQETLGTHSTDAMRTQSVGIEMES